MKLNIYRASAGSGKTHILTSEYLKLALKQPDAFRNILAVTFTNKAAGEMKSRILDELGIIATKSEQSSMLENLNVDENPEKTQKLAEQVLSHILHNYSFFSISTIDSFVQRIVRAFAFEIGIQSGYRIEMDQEKVINDLTDLLYSRISKDNDLKNWLIRFANYKINEGKNWDFRSEIEDLSKEIFKEDFQNFSSEGAISKKDLHDFFLLILKIRQDFETEMLEISKKTKSIIDRNAIDPKKLGRNFSIICNHLLKKITPEEADYIPVATIYKALDGFENWHAKSAKQDLISTIRMVYEPINELLSKAVSKYETEYPDHLSARNILINFHAFGVLNDLAELLPEYRDENNLLLISDTTLILKKIISDNPASFIYEKSGSRYQHILIDEFQDTSGFQWFNFKPLIQNALAEGNDNLIVGDIKQSIYRWRGGDWNLLLNQVKQDIGAAYINDENLTHNWRSRKNIIDFNNAFFDIAPTLLQQYLNNEIENLRPKESSFYLDIFGDIIERSYSDTFQKLPENKDNNGGLVNLNFIECSRSEMQKKWREQIITKLPETIDKLLKSGYNAGDICLLVRKNKEGAEVLEYLLEYMNKTAEAEQYRIISPESLFIHKAQSVRLIISAMKFVNKPADIINRSAFLHEVYRFGTKSGNLHNYLKSERDGGTLESVLSEKVIKSLNSLKNNNLYEISEELISLFNLHDYPEDFSYLRTFQETIWEFARNETSSLDNFLSWWDKSGVKISVQLSDKQDAVTIMTIHKSKGLAFDIVIVPFCDWETDATSGFLSNIIWCSSQDEPYKRFSYIPLQYKKELADTAFKGDFFREKLYTYMDALNMLYVAFTRPRQGLIVFAPTDKSDKIARVADILYQSVGRPQTEKQNQINLNVSYNPDKDCFVLDNEHLVKSGQSSDIKTDKLELKNYTGYDWKKRLSVKHDSTEYFIQTDELRKSKINFGKLMHEVLSKIETVSDVENAVSQLIFVGKIDLQESIIIKNHLKNFFKNEQVKDWFSDKWRVQNETVLISPEGLQRIPDRVLFKENQAVVIDFKFGEMHDDYKEQVEEYKQLIRQMNYVDVTGYLVFPESIQIIEV